MKFYLLLFCFSILVACSPKVGTHVGHPTPPAPTPEPAKILDEVETEALRLGFHGMKFTKSPCYGRCPDFDIEVSADGFVRYTGRAFVSKAGQYISRLTKLQMTSLVAEAAHCNYFQLAASYPASGLLMPEFPTTTIFFHLRENEKTIVNNYDAAPELLDFERFLQNLFDSLDWKPASQ
jgi:hypothetical protein